ncbi:MAG: phage holin family protein [Oscillospiraceae bacterium]|nr:phage holin family protein [Oscillospiraceae bacterium]
MTDSKLNIFSFIGGFLGGAASFLFGELNALFTALLVAIAIDFVAGIVKAIHNRRLSSNLCMRGVCKKVVMMSIVAAAHLTQQVTGDFAPVRNAVIGFFFVNEIISVIENAADMGIPVPEQLTRYLLILKEKYKTVNTEKDDNDPNFD